MNHIFILICMIFCHIVDDYYLQGWLASAKQKEWWQKNCPQDLYKYDYIIALLMHAFSWTFSVMLIPTIIAEAWYPVLFITNFLLHSYIDNEKANNKTINLVTDQLIHIIQIVATWFVMFIK